MYIFIHVHVHALCISNSIRKHSQPISLSHALKHTHTQQFCKTWPQGAIPLPFYETGLDPPDSIMFAFQEILAKPLINDYVVCRVTTWCSLCCPVLVCLCLFVCDSVSVCTCKYSVNLNCNLSVSVCYLLFVYMYMYHHCSPHLFCQQLKVTTEPELSVFICEVSSRQQWKKEDLLKQIHHKVFHNACMYSQLKH